jgi:surface antigen
MESAVRLSSLIFVTALFAIFSTQSITPAQAGRDGWEDRGHRHGQGGRGWGHDQRHRGRDRHDWGHDQRHWGRDRHDWRHDRGRRSNFQVIINQGYGPRHGYWPRHGYGPRYDYYDRPYYRTYHRPPPAPYYGGHDGNLLGTLFGGALGGIAGSQIGDGSGRTAAIVGGALIGAMFGNSLGQPYDHAHAANVFEVTPSNNTVGWVNPDDGIAYQVTPIRTFQASGGQYCREYQAQASVGGRPQQTYGTACRTPDGDWQIMN